MFKNKLYNLDDAKIKASLDKVEGILLGMQDKADSYQAEINELRKTVEELRRTTEMLYKELINKHETIKELRGIK